MGEHQCPRCILVFDAVSNPESRLRFPRRGAANFRQKHQNNCDFRRSAPIAGKKLTDHGESNTSRRAPNAKSAGWILDFRLVWSLAFFWQPRTGPFIKGSLDEKLPSYEVLKMLKE